MTQTGLTIMKFQWKTYPGISTEGLLGQVRISNRVDQEIIVCSQQQRFFVYTAQFTPKGSRSRTPLSTITLMMYNVVATAFKATDELKAIEWMRADSLRTPKCIVADAERSSNPNIIEDKVQKLKLVMKAHSVDQEVLGLVLGRNLAVVLKEGIVEIYDPLNSKDLSEVQDLADTIGNLNSYLHSVRSL